MSQTGAFNFQYFTASGDEKNLSLSLGEVLFVLGANGSGKSGFLLQFSKNHAYKSKKIFAQRKLCFNRNKSVTNQIINEELRKHLNLRGHDHGARWKDDIQEKYLEMSILDLISAEKESKQNTNKKETFVECLNNVLKLSNLSFEIFIDEEEKIFAVRNQNIRFGIEMLSDGERNAVLLIIDVLTADKNSLLVIDEPERHLHRSITSNMLSSLFDIRNDCAFVIATHDLDLPLINPKANILLLRECKWYKDQFIDTWEADLISAADKIDDEIKKSIIGIRRKILFVEGIETSRDKKLYSKLFPEISVISMGNCSQVEKAVIGITNSQSLNWMTALGLVDADGFDTNQLQKLKSKNIFVLPCYSIESIYCFVEIVTKIIEQKYPTENQIKQNLINDINNMVIEKLQSKKDEMCARLCEKHMIAKIKYPTWKNILEGKNYTQNIDMQTFLEKEKSIFDSLINMKNTERLITRYPIKETGILNEIAKKLEFKNQNYYERAVIELISSNQEIKDYLRQVLGDLTQKIEVS